jgi:phosphoribosyl 1,2-cyclic phosphate phosphodiesterase
LSLRVTILGSGTSHGVPSIGCDCTVCRSTDPRDQRTRPSILIDLQPVRSAADVRSQSPVAAAVQHILVDTSTDLRAQALARNIRRVDAILFTHSHADHVLGLDEVRRFNVLQRTPIGCYADAGTLADLRRMFAYIFEPGGQLGGGVPELLLFRIAGPFTMGAVDIVPIPLLHGRLPVLGFRLGPFAYLTDCNQIPDESWALLQGVRVIVLDALRTRRHATHFSVAEALDVIDRLGPEQSYLTHICHDLPHEATCATLPEGVQLAYDGLVLDIDD